LLFIIKNKEQLDWSAVGLARPELRDTALWVLITLIGVIIAAVLPMSVPTAFNRWPLFGITYKAFELTARWVPFLIVVRRAFIEELFYRGYAIGRLQALTGRRTFAVGVSLLAFALSYYREGEHGMIIALLAGAVLTAVYLYKRNLWITIIARFLTDPNILRPLGPILLSCAITLAGGNGTMVSPRSVILKAKHGPELVKACMQTNISNVTEFWAPSLADAQELEKQLPSFIAEHASLRRSIAEDYKQYVGVISKGRRLIFVSAFHIDPQIDGSLKLGWRHSPIIVCGGGDEFWRIEYNPETKEFTNFETNGPL
jgi:membrane protease YdiL (CAAX protease family)